MRDWRENIQPKTMVEMDSCSARASRNDDAPIAMLSVMALTTLFCLPSSVLFPAPTRALRAFRAVSGRRQVDGHDVWRA